MSMDQPVKILATRYIVEPRNRCWVVSFAPYLPRKRTLTTRLVIATNTRMKVKYAFVLERSSPLENVFDGVEPPKMRTSRSA